MLTAPNILRIVCAHQYQAAAVTLFVLHVPATVARPLCRCAERVVTAIEDDSSHYGSPYAYGSVPAWQKNRR